MEMQIIESFGYIDENVTLLNNDEYAHAVGSVVTVKPLKTNPERNYKYLRSDIGHFLKICHNPLTNHVATCEFGSNAQLYVKLFSYSKTSGFTQLGEITIPNALEVTCLSISRCGTRLAVLLPEPLQYLKVFEIIATANPVKCEIKEVSCIQLERDYLKFKFNPLNKNFIFLLSSTHCTVVELQESIPDEYAIDLDQENPEEILAKLQKDDPKLPKRPILTHLNNPEQLDEFIDCTWDMYNNIYISLSNGLIHLYTTALKKIQVTFQNEVSEAITNLSGCTTCMVLTQKYLLCALDNGKIGLVNMYFPEKELISFKPSIGNKESYHAFEIERELDPSVLASSGDFIVNMKYDQEFKKIIATTKKNSLILLFLKGEIMVREKEKNEEISGDSGGILTNEVECYEEIKFHQGKVIGVKELGSTSQMISISSDDRKIFVWELAERSIKHVHSLDYPPNCFETDMEGNLIFIGSKDGVLRIYDITNRANLRLVYQMKFPYNSSNSIDKIQIHPLMKYVLFYKNGDTFIYFISGEVGKNFCFLGFIQTPSHILDVSINNIKLEDNASTNRSAGSVLVLVRGLLILYNVSYFIYDNKSQWEIKQQKTIDVFANFQLQCDVKARKVDGDLRLIIKNSSSHNQEFVWLTGSDKYLRLFPVPIDNFENVKDSKKPIETPEEIKGHDLEITCGYFYNNNVIVTGSLDGTVQIRRDRNVIKSYRTHSFLNNGISHVAYSQGRKIVYACGYDGSIVIIAEDENYSPPLAEINSSITNQIIENLEMVDFASDELARNFVEYVHDQHQILIKTTKRTAQANLKAKLEEIKNEVYKLSLENCKQEEIEQLKKEEMIIDQKKIDREIKDGIEVANELTKKYFKELCELEMLKTRLYDKTYNVMRLKDPETHKFINNNIRLVYSYSGDKVLKTYPIRNIEEEELMRLNYTKQLRLMEINEKYKRRNEGREKEVIEEHLFSNMEEQFIVNRTSAKPVVTECEILPQEVADVIEGEAGINAIDDKRGNKIAKYRLQRNPYEESLKAKGEGDTADQALKRPDEHIYKEDLMMRFKTSIDYSKAIPDVEFPFSLSALDPFTLLYSPFELYTNFRVRNQIYLLLDAIHNLKKNFNEDFKTYLKERAVLLEKFNGNKTAIESIREQLPDINIPDYSYAINPHEDNEWVEKFDESEIKVPKFFSKEERKKLEEERLREEERLKALQGDTLQMRGLKHMLDNKVIIFKKEQTEENELVREPWMDKKRDEMTEEEMRKLMEYNKKELELKEMKEKKRSQNLTKLSFHQSEIENNKMDLDLKFAKILRKKLYYDYRVAEEEIYILALIRTMELKAELRKKRDEMVMNLHHSKESEAEIQTKKKNFEDVYDNFMYVSKTFMDRIFGEKNKNIKLLEEEKRLLGELDTTKNENTAEFLRAIRGDPYYYFEREKLAKARQYGNKPYRELSIGLVNPRSPSTHRSSDEAIIDQLNKKYFLDYKREQFDRYKAYLDSEYESLSAKAEQLEAEFKNLEENLQRTKLNLNIMVRIRKGQDEVNDGTCTLDMETNNEASIFSPTAIPGPSVDDTVLLDHFEIERLNKDINSVYQVKISNQNTQRDHMQMRNYIALENALKKVLHADLELKIKYLKLTRVTKKTQEIVTGKEVIDQAQIAKLYEEKKKNLEENTNKRIDNMEKKLMEISNEIDKKMVENNAFELKLDKLKEDVHLKNQIINLDNDNEEEGDTNMRDNAQKKKINNKSLEIAEVSKLKNIVKEYYEQIEYLRAELDKLRARTFPSFLQKPDQVIYPDEK